ncbi:interleukin-24 isoform X1 [Heterocephalus glaber]|uniref:Interleukin-24 isoform X1 n=1 Tax=Heterocephalus glaber TaxID=10181 RepID=A0AAX6RN72_HETGA|nr:interleukin-24 isoform X1 [Heterocephalus glaber]XP_021098088.1 interleukin-24 isoform X1 [Heterocephalus glaber]
MGPWLQTAAFPLLGLILLLWSQVPGLQGHEFRFGPCRVEGVALPSLWEAFRSLKDTVQAQDNITSIRLLRREVLQNVSDTESCHLIHDLLKFYLNTVFKNYHHKIAESNMLPSFSTLANNFVFIVSKLQPSVSRTPGSGAWEIVCLGNIPLPLCCPGFNPQQGIVGVMEVGPGFGSRFASNLLGDILQGARPLWASVLSAGEWR